MSVNFYNESGTMWGMDLHDYVAAGEVPAMNFHIVLVPFLWPLYFFPKKVESVTTDTWASFQNGMDFYLVPHVPLWMVIPPGGGETAQLVKVIATSGSKAWMAVHKVRFGGDKAATCLFWAVSKNMNCGDPIDTALTNWVLNLNTVKTQPTAGDYVGSYVGAVSDALLSMAVGTDAKKAGEKFGGDLVEELINQVWRRAPDIEKEVTGQDPHSDIPGKVTDTIQQAIDGEPPTTNLPALFPGL